MSRGQVCFVEVVARKKLGASSAWLMHGWEAVGKNDLIVSGGVPVGTYTRGPRKGRPKWVGKSDKVVVTAAEQHAEKAAFEQETGNCAECQGTKETWAGWNCETGNRYRPCAKCAATGLASHGGTP